jgi:hypothetical protein
MLYWMLSLLSIFNNEIEKFAAPQQDKKLFVIKYDEITELLLNLIEQYDQSAPYFLSANLKILQEKVDDLTTSWASFKENSASEYFCLCCNNFYASNCFQNQLY